jgi:AraC-like DNA-binding protein
MISSKTGFSDTKYFSRVFKRSTGLTPTEYMQSFRKKG